VKFVPHVEYRSAGHISTLVVLRTLRESEVWPYPDLRWPSFSPWSPYTVRTASTSLGWPLRSTSNGSRWRSRWAIASYGKPRSCHSCI